MSSKIINNDAVSAVLSRQAIRKYKDLTLSEDELLTLKECALRAPSSFNKQSCHVRFVTNSDMLSQMQTDFETIEECSHPFYYDAPVMVFLFADGEHGIDAGLLIENLAVGAKALGLGSCIIGSIRTLFEEPELGSRWKRMLNIPESYSFQMSIAIGHPNELPFFTDRDETRIEFID